MQEEAFEQLMDSYLKGKKAESNSHQGRVFACGFFCGIVFSFTNLVGFVAGGVAGIFLARKCEDMTDSWLEGVYARACQYSDLVRSAVTKRKE